MEELQSSEMLQLTTTRCSSSSPWEDSTFTNTTQKPQPLTKAFSALMSVLIHLLIYVHIRQQLKLSDFLGQKYPQHAFVRKGSKAVCPMSQICGMLKNPVIKWKLGHR
jgi:hypothetical protein